MNRVQSGALSARSDKAQAVAQALETWFATASEYQREMMGFVSMRLEKDADTTREILGCRSLADVTAIQSRWMEETMHDYNSEVDKLMSLCTRSAEPVDKR
ncbi:phasin family protein [Microvirga sp. BT291]|nr:phasin family protein [Microvirga pudoricolor]